MSGLDKKILKPKTHICVIGDWREGGGGQKRDCFWEGGGGKVLGQNSNKSDQMSSNTTQSTIARQHQQERREATTEESREVQIIPTFSFTLHNILHFCTFESLFVQNSTKMSYLDPCLNRRLTHFLTESTFRFNFENEQIKLFMREGVKYGICE